MLLTVMKIIAIVLLPLNLLPFVMMFGGSPHFAESMRYPLPWLVLLLSFVGPSLLIWFLFRANLVRSKGALLLILKTYFLLSSIVLLFFVFLLVSSVGKTAASFDPWIIPANFLLALFHILVAYYLLTA